MLSDVRLEISVAEVPVYSTVPVDWVNVPLLINGLEPAAPEPVRVRVLEPLAVKVWEALIVSFSIFAEEAKERVVAELAAKISTAITELDPAGVSLQPTPAAVSVAT